MATIIVDSEQPSSNASETGQVAEVVAEAVAEVAETVAEAIAEAAPEPAPPIAIVEPPSNQETLLNQILETTTRVELRVGILEEMMTEVIEEPPVSEVEEIAVPVEQAATTETPRSIIHRWFF